MFERADTDHSGAVDRVEFRRVIDALQNSLRRKMLALLGLKQPANGIARSVDEARRIAAESLRLTRRIVAQPALAKYKPREYKPGVQFQTDEELARLAGDIGTTIFHPVGTCRMGPQPQQGAVVDARLRVHGIAGLRIADASVMPTITSGNTNSPTLMIAERAAEWIVRDNAAAG